METRRHSLNIEQLYKDYCNAFTPFSYGILAYIPLEISLYMTISANNTLYPYNYCLKREGILTQ